MTPTTARNHFGLRRATILFVATLALQTATVAAEDRLAHRRGGLSSIAIERAAATNDGLSVVRTDRGLDREEVVPWDRLAGVDPRLPEGTLEVGIDRGLALGDRLWRGRNRLRRGDARLAREAFLEAFELIRERRGPMFSIALEGLVASAILEGRVDDIQSEAVFLGELGLAGSRTDRFAGPAFGGDVIDAETQLVPMVPPVTGGPASLKIRERLRDRPRIHENSGLRRDLWIRLLDGSGPPELEDRSVDAGTRYLVELTNLDSKDRRTRESARRRLIEQLDGQPGWRTAWTRHRAGRSSLQHAENDEERLRGILDLVRVMALEDTAPPALRLDSGRLLIDGLRSIGRNDEARTIDTMLMIEFPDQHPTENAP